MTNHADWSGPEYLGVPESELDELLPHVLRDGACLHKVFAILGPVVHEPTHNRTR